ncbi:MAG: efflux transporter outer membrane subunit [Deltaproteobacteria bacterium]|nr:efflux transporter outer membrane subunit [Deltaproteobacteria bacterium]
MTPRGALAALLAVALAGCAVGPRYRRPEGVAPAAYRASAEDPASIADLPWFEVFRDPVLRAHVEEALANNRDLLAAASRVEQARGLAAVQRGELFPDAGYELDVHREHDATFGSPTPDTGTESLYLGVLNAAWELDVWGRIRRATEAARSEMLASEAFRRGIVLSLVTGVAQAYFELRELDLELAITRRTVESFRETRDLFERQFRGGVTSKLDYLRGEAALAQAAASLPDLERRIVAKENELSVLLGRPAGEIERGAVLTAQELPPEVPPGIPSQLLERRPDVIEAEEVLHAETARIGEAFAGFFPRIGLTAVAGRTSGELDSALSGPSFWTLVGSAVGPLFTFGRTWYGWRASEAGAQAALHDYQQSVLVALQDVSNALTAREKLAQMRVEQGRAVEALGESLRIARIRYVGGLATYLEVLDAQQQLFPAELDLARTQRDELNAVVALYRALGGGWQEAPPAPTIPQPLAP